MTSVATPLRGRGKEVGVTLPSWTQQGQKERGLRRGVPPLGSTSKRAKQGGGGDETDREEEAFGSGEGQGEGEVDKKHKSEKGTTGGKEKNTRNGKAEARETQSTNEFSPSFIRHRNWSGAALGPGGRALCPPQVLAGGGGWEARNDHRAPLRLGDPPCKQPMCQQACLSESSQDLHVGKSKCWGSPGVEPTEAVPSL